MSETAPVAPASTHHGTCTCPRGGVVLASLATISFVIGGTGAVAIGLFLGPVQSSIIGVLGTAAPTFTGQLYDTFGDCGLPISQSASAMFLAFIAGLLISGPREETHECR